MDSITIERIILILSTIFLVSIPVGFGQEQRQSFRERPSNVTVHQGKDTQLRCVIAHRQAEAQWIKDGTALAFGSTMYGNQRYTIDDSRGEYNLHIRAAQLEDDSEYECQVRAAPNDESSQLRAKAFVNVLIPPNNIVLDGITRDSVVEKKAGDDLNVECRASGAKPAAHIRWYKNNQLLSESDYDNTVTDEGDKRSATLSKLHVKTDSRDDGAIYTCEAVHTALTSGLSTLFKLSVIYPPNVPVVTGYDVGKAMIVGDQLTLRCSVEGGNPPPRVVWFRNSVAVSSESTRSHTKTENTYTFRVQPSDNRAEYKCEAANSATFTPSSSVIHTTVYFAPEKVEIFGPDEAKFGDEVRFTCNASASFPEAKLEWYFDHDPYPQHQPKSIQTTTGTESSSAVTFKITRKRPELTVSCRAVNEQVARASKMDAPYRRKTIRISYPPDSVALSVNDGKKTFTAGEKATLTCIVRGGNPSPSVEWFRKDRKVPTASPSRFEQTLNATISEYSFDVAPEDNMKDVQCRAFVHDVPGDRLSDSVTLRVNFGPEKLSITQSPREIEAGSNAELTCETSSANPGPIVEWYRNGEQLMSVVSHNNTSDFNGYKVKKKLSITPIVQDNGAVYECRAWSSIFPKPVATKHTMEVFYKPIFLVPIAQSFEVLEGESITLNATAYGNPTVDQYLWQKDNAPYSSASPRVIIGGPLIEMKEVKRTDAGKYGCKAKNGIGNSAMGATVVVKYPATVSSINPTLTVDTNASVVLTCEVDAFPMPLNVARWERDDENEMKERRFTRNVTKISDRKIKYQLSIHPVYQGDTGNYTCVVSNGIGKENSSTTTLLVRQPPTLDHGPIYKKAAAPVGGVGELVCAADGVPEVRFEWRRDGRPVRQNERTSVSSGRIGFMKYEGRLTIRGVQEKDYGTYHCVADNGLGSRSMEIKFGKPEPPDQPYGLLAANTTHESVTLNWLPGFGGGLPQKFIIKYRQTGQMKNGQEPSTPVVALGNSLTIDNLKAKATYLFTIQAVNAVGSSGFVNLTVETLGPASIVQEDVKGELSILIIVLVCLVGVLLLVINAALIVCFLRRHRRKKLEERATNTRLGSSSVRKIQMYSSEGGAGGGGGVVYQRGDGGDGDHRSRSAISNDNGSIRTVIEVDGSNDAQDGFAIASGSPRMHGGYLLDNGQGEFDEDPSDNNYAEALRTNTLQRHLANGVYNVQDATIRQGNVQDRNMNTYVPAQSIDDFMPPTLAAGPLRDTINQEYGPYSYYQSPSGTRTLERKYSPPQSAHLYANGRTPLYAEVRPLLGGVPPAPLNALPPLPSSHHQHHHGSPVRNLNHRAHAGSPILSTFAANNGVPLRSNVQGSAYNDEDADSLSGDLV